MNSADRFQEPISSHKNPPLQQNPLGMLHDTKIDRFFRAIFIEGVDSIFTEPKFCCSLDHSMNLGHKGRKFLKNNRCFPDKHAAIPHVFIRLKKLLCLLNGRFLYEAFNREAIYTFEESIFCQVVYNRIRSRLWMALYRKPPVHSDLKPD